MDSIDDVFGELIEESGLDPARLREARLHEEWEEIVGEELARHLSPHRLDNSELVLHASDPSWSHEASMMTARIRESVNEYLGHPVVDSVRIVH